MINKKYGYTLKETKFILDNYKTMSDSQLGKKLNRTDDTIQKKLKQLGVKRNKIQIRNNFLKSLTYKKHGCPKKYIFKKKYRKFITIAPKKRIAVSHYSWCSQPGNLSYVPTGFVIHHIDGNQDNNSPNNLFLMTKTDHNKFHNAASNMIRSKL